MGKTVRVSLQGIMRSFRTERGTIEALGPLDLVVHDGEFLCCVGPSGCGKTTLLHIIAGLERPDSGQVLVSGRKVEGPIPDCVVIFQELGLFPWMTVLGNVEFGLKLRHVAPKDRKEQAYATLELVGLRGFERAYVHELSGGMKQRVALARALAVRPAVLLMDEPFAALDAQTRDMLHEELQQLVAHAKMTVVFVTHNVREAACLGDRVVTFTVRPGRVKNEYPVVLPRPRHIEDTAVIGIAAKLREDIRYEIERALIEEKARAQGS